MIKPIKIAILSCNHGHAKSYYDLINNPLFELVGISIVYGSEAIERLPDSIPRYRTDEELYNAHPELEAVIIASDNKTHMQQVRDAAKRGLHIFSMKIPTFDLDEYREMVELTEKNGLAFQVELEMRHHAPLYHVRDIIQSGKYGKLLSINMVNYSHNPVWWRGWQCDPEASFGKVVSLKPDDPRFRGGALADHPHVFDAIRFVTGASFDTVYANVAPNLRDSVKVEEMVRLIGKLDNGAIFSIDPSYANDEHHVPVQVEWEKYPRCVEVYMTAVCEKGTIICDLYGKTFCRQTGRDGEYMCVTAWNQLWNRRIQEFYECVREGEKPPVGLRDHYASIVTMLAAYESISTGKPVKVNNTPNF